MIIGVPVQFEPKAKMTANRYTMSVLTPSDPDSSAYIGIRIDPAGEHAFISDGRDVVGSDFGTAKGAE